MNNVVYDADGWISVHPQRQHIEFTYPMLTLLYSMTGACWKTLAFMMQHCYAYDEQAQDFVRGPHELSLRFIANGTEQHMETVGGALAALARWNMVVLVKPGTLARPGHEGTPAMWTVNWRLRVRPAEGGGWQVEGVDEVFVPKSEQGKNTGARKIRSPQAAPKDGGGRTDFPLKDQKRRLREEERRSLRATDPTGSEGGGNDDSSSLEGNPGGSGATATAGAIEDPTMRTNSPVVHTGVIDDDDDDDIAPTLEMMQLISYFRTRTTREPNAVSPSYQDRWLRPVAHLLKQCHNDVVVAKEIMGEAIDRANGRNSSNRAYTVATPASLVTWMNTLVAERLATSQAVTADDLWEKAFDALINRTHDDLQLTKAIDVVGSRRILNATKADAPALKISLLNAYIAA